MNKKLFPKIEVNKQLSYALLGFALVIIVLVDFLFIMKPQLKALTSLNKKIAKSAKVVKETKENLQRLPVLQEEVRGLKEKLGKVEKSILLKDESILAVDTISRLANQSNLQVNQIMPLQNAEVKIFSNSEGDYFSLPISLTAEAGYHDIGAFFSRIEASEIFMSVDRFEISRNVRTARKNILTATISVFILKKK